MAWVDFIDSFISLWVWCVQKHHIYLFSLFSGICKTSFISQGIRLNVMPNQDNNFRFGFLFCPAALVLQSSLLYDIPWMRAMLCFSLSCSQQINTSAGLVLTHFSIAWCPLHAPAGIQSTNLPLRSKRGQSFGRQLLEWVINHLHCLTVLQTINVHIWSSLHWV